MQGRNPCGRRILGSVGECRERPLDRLGVDQAGVDGQRLICVLAIETEADRAATAQDVKLAAKAIAPRILHAQDVDAVDGKFDMGALELAIQHLPFLSELLGIRQVLQLAAATTGREIGTGRIDARGRRLQDGRRLGAPEILPPMGDLSLNRLARNSPFDEDHSAIDPRQGRPAVGQLADRQLH